MPVVTATISIMPGQSLSTALDCTLAAPVRIRMPVDWQGGGTDVITFQTSGDGITFYDFFTANGKEVDVIVTPGVVIAVLLDWGLKSGQFLKLRAGRRSSPVVQTVQRDFVFHLE